MGPTPFTLAYVVIACLACLAVGYQVHYRLDKPLTRHISDYLVVRGNGRPAGGAVRPSQS